MTERRNTIGDEVPNRIGQDENGDNWRRNEAEIREYAAIARDRAVQRAELFVVLILIGTGLRFCWWQWTRKEVVIRLPAE
ncbi:unnamed protein product [Orchesella dallaii]|uniref:Uncharacterized protein n=1 Tax=Orchesella dallaii TaxID=48710 RepID=A0ABP1S6U4_9HEXA